MLLPATGSAAVGGAIEGTAVDATSEVPIEGVEVCAYEVPEFEFWQCEETDAAGTYTLAGLPAGSYVVEFWGGGNGLNYRRQFFDGKSSFEEADEVEVTVGHAVSNVDASMEPGGTISGAVTDALSGLAVEGIEACAFGTPELEFGGCTKTDAVGEYQLGGLAAGSYIVEFWGVEEGYVTQYFDGHASYEDADEVPVVVGSTSGGVDAELRQGGRIRGTVTDASTHLPVEEVEVCAYGATNFRCTYTDAGGQYALAALGTDSYVIEFWAVPLGYPVQFYDDKPSFPQANTVSLTAPGIVLGVDAHLEKTGGVVVPPLIPVAPDARIPTASAPPGPQAFGPAAPRCRKGFKKVKRRGKKVCVRKRRGKHRSAHR